MGSRVAANILKQIQSNDREFVGELHLLVQKLAYKFNFRDPQATDDLVQDCFVKILTNLQKGRFEGRSSFRTYVYTIVRRTCIDHWRSNRFVDSIDISQIPLVDSAPLADEKILQRQRRKVAARILLSLPGECRRLWRTIFYGKRNYRETASLLKMKEGTVKRKMWECRKKAAKKLVEYEQGEPMTDKSDQHW